jgi:hypothetical protein
MQGHSPEAVDLLWEVRRNYTVGEIADRASRVLTQAIAKWYLPCGRVAAFGAALV